MKYEVCGDITKIFLPSRTSEPTFTVVDTDDLQRIEAFSACWFLHVTPKGFRYVLGSVWRDRRTHNIRLHRFITDAPRGLVVDHINHDTLDNRKSNLRVVTNSVNMLNRARPPRNNTSGYRGVFWYSRQQRFVGELRVNGVSRRTAGYTTAIEAAYALRDMLDAVDPIAAANYQIGGSE